ncbi:hypothetical protein [Undibacterium sp.]|uniref:hypothetical protein n=1 Tax=Undibacterium sp. TaxID=1914977 RepID=UPI0025D67CA1|nr:hypothetical protein [Undibacterium sp.]
MSKAIDFIRKYNSIIPVIREPLNRYAHGVFAGVSISALFILLEFFSTSNVKSVVHRSAQSFMGHYMEFPVELLDVVGFVIGLTFVVSNVWGRFVRKYIAKPLFDFLLHLFSISAGVLLTIFLHEIIRDTSASFPKMVIVCLFVELYSFIFGIICGVAAYLCTHDLSNELKKSKIIGTYPWILVLSSWLSMPLGFYLMWGTYQDFLRLSSTVATVH